ncbi:MAG: multiheme c-type cytochrome [Planctomycetota bacterium]
MSPLMRVGVIVGILSAVAVGVTWLNRGGDVAQDIVGKAEGENLPPIPTADVPLALDDPETCAACHPAIYDEWKRSHHAFSWLNPEPRRKELSDDFKNRDCIPCHAPRPMLEVGFGKRALERGERRETGVDCFTCHKHENAMIGAGKLGPQAASAPCNPRTWEPIAEVTFCAPCHDQHKVVQSWKKSRFALEGEQHQDCNSCHMPVADGPATLGTVKTSHKSHLFGGGNDPATVRRAATLRATFGLPGESRSAAVKRLSGRDWTGPGGDVPMEAREVLVQVENTGAGHNFPDDERHRAVDLVLAFQPEGKLVGPGVQVARFRNPYRHEWELTNPFKERAGEILRFEHEWEGSSVTSRQLRMKPAHNPDRSVPYPESTQLIAGESRFVWIRLPQEGAGRLEISLYYKKNPFLTEDQAILANRESLDVAP